MAENLHQEALTEAQVQIAVLRAEAEHRDREIERLTKAVETLTTKVEAIANTLTEARGGWKTLMLLGGAGAAAGSFLSWAFQHVTIGK